MRRNLLAAILLATLVACTNVLRPEDVECVERRTDTTGTYTLENQRGDSVGVAYRERTWCHRIRKTGTDKTWTWSWEEGRYVRD